MSNERSQSGVFIVLGVIVLIVGALAYMVTHRTPRLADIPPPDPDPRTEPVPASVNFYLDGSGSIKHFLTVTADADGNERPNYMMVFLDKAGTTLSAWNGRVSFHQFGTAIGKIPNDDPHEMSLHPENFHAGNTSIENAINDPQRGKGEDGKRSVEIYVTDLYENGGRLERPATALEKTYLSPASNPDGQNAVDVLAVRNPHDGDVEDMPGSTPNGVVPKAADSMPFYVIVAGPKVEVRQVMQLLLTGTELKKAKDNHQATEFLFTRTPMPHRTDDMTPGPAGAKNFRALPGYTDRSIPFMLLSDGIMEMSWDDSVKPEPGVISLYCDPAKQGACEPYQNNQELRATVLVPPPSDASPEKSKNTPAAIPEQWVPLQGGESAIGDCAQKRLLCRSVDRSKLPKDPGTYILRFDRVAVAPTAVLEPDSPELLHKWNIEERDAENIWKASQKNPPPGKQPYFEGRIGLTPDLSKFLKTLQGPVFRPPLPITTYYVYLQAK